MGGSVDQSALVVLAVDLDKRAADVAHQRDAGGLVVDEDAGAAVGGLHAAQDDVAVVVERVFGEDGARRMVLRHVEDGRHLALSRAVADQRGIAARAERQRQGIKQDGFAGAGLAGQDREAGRKIDVQPLDQDDIADRQAGQHSGNFFKHDLFRKPVPTFRDHAVFEHDLFRNWLPPFGIMLQIVRRRRRVARPSKSTSRHFRAAQARRSAAVRRNPCTTGCQDSCGRAPPPPSGLPK